ncbi:MAG: YhdP family protein [Gammaproteobacteria bacterium]|nr:YhdP family protein [Gammaproteobacteria bacterium]
MPPLLKKALRWAVGTVCAALLVVALLLGVLRVLMPLVPTFQEEIAEWTSNSLGYPVEFARIEPSWGLTGPEFRLRGVRVMSERGGGPLLLADEILVGINLWTLLPGPGLNLDRMSIVGARLSLRRLGPESFSVQGRDPAYYPGGPARMLAFAPPEIQLRDVWVDFEEPGRNVSENLWLERLSMTIADGRIVLDGRMVLPEEYGDWLGVGADIELAQWTRPFLPAGRWRLHLEGRSVDLAKIGELVTEAAELPLIGSGDFNVFVDFNGAEVEQLLGELDFEDLWAAGGSGDHVFDRLAGQFEWQRQGNVAVLTASRLEAARNGEDWPDTEVSASWTLATGGELAALQLEAGFVRLEDAIPPLLAIAGRLGVSPALVPLAGDVNDLSLSWDSGGPALPEIRADFSGLTVEWQDRGLTLAGVDGSLRNESGAGNADLSISGDGGFAASWLDGSVDLTGAQAELSWRTGPESWSFEGNNVRIGTEGMEFAGRFSLALPEGGSSPVLELSGGGDSIGDLPAALKLLPWNNTRGLPFGWLSRALHAGRAGGWNMQLSGPLDSFPFGGAVLRVEMALSDGALTVHEDWPDVADLSGTLVLNGSSLVILDAAGELAGVRWRGVRTDVRDLTSPVVEVNGESDDPVPALIAGLARIPMADRIHPMLLNAETSGQAGTRVEFRLPVEDRGAWEIHTETVLGGAELKLNALIPAVTNLQGSIRFSRAGVRARELQGRFLDQPLVIDVDRAPAGTAGYAYRVDLDGAAAAEELEGLFACCALDRLNGQFAWQGSVLLPSLEADPVRPVRLRLETDLLGLASDLPYPMNKPADESGPTRLELRWGSGAPPRLAGRLGLGPGVALEFADGGDGWRIASGRLHFGDSLPRVPQGAGLVVDGRLDSLRPADWARLLADQANSLDLPWEVDLIAGEVYAMGSTLRDQSIRARPRADGWLVEFQGEFADGRLFWPRAGDENGQLLAQLNSLRLTLPDPDPQPPANPRQLPAGKLLLDDLVIGQMRLGEVRARYEKTTGGLAVNWFRTESPAFSSEGSAAWLVADDEGAEQLGRLDMVLQSSDVAGALEQLGYARGISGDRGEMALSANWDGPPSGNFLARSNGTVNLEVERGEVAALDPGSGRMLGMLSLARLPRRLALDFRDVTEEGLPFDRLAGDFSLREGQAYTCNMGLQGAVASLALFGRTGLQDRSYDQVAVVSPNLPDLLSLGGVIVGGTGLGATMLLLSQAFREPLQAISANYYRVGGSWDEPLVERVLREEIDLGAFEDCARYLEEQLTDMPVVDWEALLSTAEDAAVPQQGEDAP